MMHDDITRFSEHGVVVETHFQRAKETVTKALCDRMYDEGYLLVADLSPHWTLHRNDEKDHYEFCLTLFGVYVGEDIVEQEFVWSDGRAIRAR